MSFHSLWWPTFGVGSVGGVSGMVAGGAVVWDMGCAMLGVLIDSTWGGGRFVQWFDRR